MSATKREEVSSHLRYIRLELREMHQMLIKEDLLPDLNEAKEGIELLRMLQKKTAGNLDEKETQILSGVISEVQMAFVSAPEREEEYKKNKQEEDKIKQAFTNPKEGPAETILEEE